MELASRSSAFPMTKAAYCCRASLALTIARLPCYRLVMAINLLASLSVQQLHRAVAIKEQIAALETDLSQILGVPLSMTPIGNRRGRRKRSAAVRARMAAAQKARWAKSDGKPAKKPRRKMSARARANLAAAARVRWAKAKAAAGNRCEFSHDVPGGVFPRISAAILMAAIRSA